MKSTIQIGLFALLAVATFTGCSKHDDDKKPDAWNGEIRLTSGITTQTRATQDYQSAQLEANTLVGVFINEHGGSATTYTQNMQYTANGTGGFINPPTVCFPAGGNPVDIYAYAPYDALCNDLARTYTFTVKSNQHSLANYIASDLLWGEPMSAEATPKKLNPVTRTKEAVNLHFRHLLSKVRVTLANGAGLTNEDVIKIELLDLLPSTDLKMADGTLSAAKGTKGNVALFDADYLEITTASAIVVPQTVNGGSKFLRFGLQSGGELFYTLPKALTMESGKIYDYTITLNLTGLTVTSTVTDWATGESSTGGAEMDFPPIGSKKAEDAVVGDFYFSDGSLEEKDATLTDAQKAACVGVVYWVGDPTNGTDGDPLLATQHPGCTHGLVVALHEAKHPSGAATMKWSAESEQVNDWTNHGDRGANKVDITAENKMQGYANTIALKAYNAQQGNANLKVLPIAAIEQYSTDHPAPANSSGWYLPSIMELKYICCGQGNDESTIGRDLLNGQFAKAGGTQFDVSSPGVYWSSSEFQESSYIAWDVRFDGGLVYANLKTNGYSVRAVSAF